MIYNGKRITKEAIDDIEKGDVGYVAYKDLPDVIECVGFLLSEVVNWSEFKNTVNYYKCKERMMVVEGNHFKYTLIEDFHVFNKKMHEFKKQNLITFKNQ